MTHTYTLLPVFYRYLLAPLAALLLLAAAPTALAQTTPSGGVGIGTTAPNAKAALEIVSSEKGLLIPRLTVTERGAIAAPVPAGLLVYQTDGTQPGFWYYEATNGWTYLNPTGDGAGDNLGDHTATQAVRLNDNALTNNGTGGIRIDDAGQVGIGTSSPTAPLHIAKAATVTTSSSGPNLAANAVASASSIYDADYPASGVNDGSTGSTWSAAGGAGLPQWVQLDLGSSPAVVKQYQVYLGAYNYAAGAWDMQGSNDASAWTTLHTVSTDQPAGTYNTYAVTNTTAYRYYRLLISRARTGYTSSDVDIAEWRLMSSVGGTTSTPAVAVRIDPGTLQLGSGAAVGSFSTDGTLAGNSDASVPTEQAVKTYVDAKVAGGGTGNQTLSINGQNLSISGGNTITLPAASGDNLGNHTATEDLNLQGNALTGDGANINGIGLGVRADGGLNIGQNAPRRNFLLGYEAGQSATTGNDNHFVGYQAGQATTTGAFNQFVGLQSGYFNTTGSSNLFSGYQSGYNSTTGDNNVFSGFRSGVYSSTGSQNVFLGSSSGLINTTGSNNVALGYNSGPNRGDLTNAIAIGANVQATQSNTMVLGNGVKVGIGTSEPTQKLEVADGNIKIATTGNGLVFPDGTFQTTAASGDNLGNHTATTNIGLNGNWLSNAPGNANGLRVTDGGNVGIGTADPQATLHVNGSTRLSGLAGSGTRVVTADANGNLATTATSTLGDNLGNHTATQNLNLQTNALTGNGANISGIGLGVRADGGLNIGQNNQNQNLALGYGTGSTSLGAYNQFVGLQSGAYTTGEGNLFVGYQSGLYNGSGNYNQFVGRYSGRNNTTGSYNLFMGESSGNSNTTGSYNQFVGYRSGQANTTGEYNLFMGYESGRANTTGGRNMFSGNYSGYSNTTGIFNQFIGNYSGYANTTGQENLFVGYGSGSTNTTGFYNQFIGFRSGEANTTGSNNQFSGYYSGYRNTTGSSNQFSGYESGNANTSGNNNLFSGYRSGLYSTTGSNNQFSGYESGYFNTTGENNLFLGFRSGYLNETGVGNTVVGSNSGPTYAARAITNATALGANVTLTTSNTVVLGNGANVGIGTSSPTQKLEVAGGIKFTGLSNALTFPDGTTQTSAAASSTASNGLTRTGTNITLGGTLTQATTIDQQNNNLSFTNGRVGIGTTSPGHPLTVQSDANGRFLGFNDMYGGDRYNFSMVSGGLGGLNLSESNIASGRLFIQAFSGNIGIGTITPTDKLEWPMATSE
ncbi:discoidin domain-containing protein [Hymenobacter sp. J193]|uniref:beta strand repeat-containing protein n=1 Tax=Hymenobacter sp. J193 TaxID=2898429 RepID=UPI00215135AA|nr:discoidin domain-containing protein [Hymenobacter sp. J193]MCR5889671.1 discoidin domain-containing protein [Hymenobacter sp. J193]